jgi:glutaconate CoA-transferase, subunit B
VSERAAYTSDEMMTVAAARFVRNGAVLFVGIGLPSAAANLALRTHAPETVLIYESGCLGARPSVLPPSIGDGELAETATAVVSVPEMFAYWLQGGRIDTGFLGAAQIDRFANVNTTVIGDYAAPRVRLPGAGGAPEIATSCGDILIVLRQNPRAFVDRLDFVTSPGLLPPRPGPKGPGDLDREFIRSRGRGPIAVITDLGVLTPDVSTRELTLTSIHPGIDVDAVKAATGWPLAVSPALTTTGAPSEGELAALRDLQARTMQAHRA